MLPNATLTMEQGFRYNWAIPATTTTDVRALQSPDATERRATGWYHSTQLRLRLDFSAAYTGTLHVYGFDWENAGRRMSVTVTDGTTTKTVPVTTSFQQGVWIHFPVSVPAGGFVRVTANKTAANNAVIAGLFLGGAGAPPTPTPSPTPTPTPSPTPTPPPYETGVKGTWVGTYGADGYALGGWTGPGNGDLAVLPNATLTMEQGFRYNWAIPADHDRCAGAPEPGRHRAPGDRLVPRHAAPLAPRLQRRIHRHAPRLRLRLGERGPADVGHRHRRHDHQDGAGHDQLPARRLDPLPGQRSGGRLRPGDRQQDRRQQRRHRRPVPGRRRDAANANTQPDANADAPAPDADPDADPHPHATRRTRRAFKGIGSARTAPTAMPWVAGPVQLPATCSRSPTPR